MSGSTRISSAGTAATAIAAQNRSRPDATGARARTNASAGTSATLANSEGWKSPRIQRCAPMLFVVPTPGTNTSASSSSVPRYGIAAASIHLR